MDVIIGPCTELHVGVHGSLIENPPPGVRYLQPAFSHVCLFTADPDFPANPFDQRSVSEAVRFELPPGPAIVHSSRLPVDGGLPWLADTDDLVATLEYGQCFALGSRARPAARAAPTQRRAPFA